MSEKGKPKRGEDKSFLEGIGEFGKAVVETPAKIFKVADTLDKRRKKINKETAKYR